MNKTKNLIKAGRAVNSFYLNNRLFVNVTYEKKTIRAIDHVPYGFAHNPPKNSLSLLLSQNGQESSAFSITGNPDTSTLKNLKEGESGIQNDLTGAFVHLNAAGQIVVDAPGDVLVNAGGDIIAVASGNVDITAGGTAKVTATSATIDAATTTITGALIVQGLLTYEDGIAGTAGGNGSNLSGALTITSGDIIADGVSLKTHTHGGVTTGAGSTGVPE